MRIRAENANERHLPAEPAAAASEAAALGDWREIGRRVLKEAERRAARRALGPVAQVARGERVGPTAAGCTSSFEELS